MSAYLLDKISQPTSTPGCGACADGCKDRGSCRVRDDSLTSIPVVMEALGDALRAAMEQTMKARIPECGEFSRIAQDLDFAVAALREILGTQRYRVWPDGTVQPVSDGQPHGWVSDDYVIVLAHSPEEALEMCM